MSCVLFQDRWCSRSGKKHDQSLGSSAREADMTAMDRSINGSLHLHDTLSLR